MSTQTQARILQLLREEREARSHLDPHTRRIRLHSLGQQLSGFAERDPEAYDAAVDAHEDELQGAAA